MTEQFTYELHGALYVNLTNRCTNRCDFCIRSKADGVGGYDLWLKREPEAGEIIAQIPDPARYDEIVFCGYGEPTIRLDALLEVAAYVKERGGRTRINTNGQASLYHGRNVAPEMKGKIDTVSVSLNAPTAEAYQQMCHSAYGEDAYEAIQSFVRSCLAAGIEAICSVVDVLGVEDIERCREITKKLGAKFRLRHDPN
jgi:TatD family-associated radical SAM protein